jgi:ATP-dependent helicase/nuclease subunit B
VTRLTSQRRFTARSLRAIEASAFDRKPLTAVPVDDGLERIAAPDRAAEVDAVARRIRDLTRDGVRLRDITVLLRDLSKYQSLLTTCFREHGIAHFIDTRRSAMHHPLLQWLRSVLAIARKHWPHEETIALLKTGLADVPLDAADELENYVLLHGLAGDAWESPEPWDLKRSTLFVGEDEEAIETDTLEPVEVDQHRRKVLARLRPFLDVLRHQPRLTFRQISTELFKLIDAFGVRNKLSKWADQSRADGRLELAAEHEQTWANLVELFDELVDLLGDHEVSLDDFVQTLESGLESFDYALTPPTLDQVEVGEIERSRAVDAKYTFVLGLAEGLFPMAGTEPTVLTDTDRGLLRRRSIELDDDISRKLLDERLLGYLAFTRASQRLILTRPAGEDGGKPLNPSPFWQKLDALFPDAARITSDAPCFAHDRPECIATPRQLVTGLMRWARRFAERESQLNQARPANASGDSPAASRHSSEDHRET